MLLCSKHVHAATRDYLIIAGTPRTHNASLESFYVSRRCPEDNSWLGGFPIKYKFA